MQPTATWNAEASHFMPTDSKFKELVREALREEIRSVLREVPLEIANAPPSGVTTAHAVHPHEPTALWDSHQAAAFLHVSRSWIFHKAAAGSIPCFRIGHNLRFDPEALRAWAHGERGAGRVVAMKK